MNFFDTLPEGYTENFVIDAKSQKTGVIMNVAAIAVFIVFTVVAVILKGVDLKSVSLGFESLIFLIAFIVAVLAYTVLHELVHGLFYKIFTRRKLTFGITWSAAFCGVPDVYVKKAPMLVTILAPFVVFLLAAFPFLFIVTDARIFVLLAAFTGIHIGGCSGDLYGAAIMLFKYSKHPELLVNDTGPKQTFFIKE